MAEATDIAEIDEVHDLYRIDPSEFVEARAALVKQLRAEGRKDEAKAVVKLRKPTIGSWALDQVAVDEPDLIATALAAGEALQVATTETLEGDASNLRAATDAERKASAAVIDAAANHLPSLTADNRDRMSATLRTAITDGQVRSLLLTGLLATDHEPPAMGFTAAAPPDTAPTVKSAATKTSAKKAPGGARATLAAKPPADEPARPKRKVRRVGTPSAAARPPVDEVDAKRRAKEVERLQAEEAERKQAEAERAKERRRQQAVLDATATKARTKADRLEEKARQAEEAAAAARADAEEATAEAAQAEATAADGPTV